MNRIDTGNIAAGFNPLDPSSDLAASERRQMGALLGDQVQLLADDDDISSLDDTAEEMSLHMAEKTEDKHHAERKVEPDRPHEVLDPDEIVQMFQQGKDGAAQQKLTELAKKLLAGQGAPRQLARQAFGDVAQQYLGLQYALREGEKQGAAPEALEAIRDALADLEMDSGPQIRASLNTLGAAGEFAADAQGVAHFQATYRDIVLGESALPKTLALALERFGGQDVSRGLTQLVAALGQDLAATRPSTEPSRLRALTADLYQLQVAVTVLDGCGELSAQLQAGGGAPIDAPRLMRDLVGVSGEKWVAQTRFASLAQQHRVTALPARIAFLSGVKTMLHELPVQVYPDADARQSVLNAVQEALDAAIDEEDA